MVRHHDFNEFPASCLVSTFGFSDEWGSWMTSFGSQREPKPNIIMLLLSKFLGTISRPFKHEWRNNIVLKYYFYVILYLSFDIQMTYWRRFVSFPWLEFSLLGALILSMCRSS